MLTRRSGINVTISDLKPYVDMVVQILDPAKSTDPARSTIKGIAYSARGEYMHIQQYVHQFSPFVI